MPMKLQTLAMAADQTFENYRKPTRRDEFLKTMEAIVPWAALCEVIEPHSISNSLIQYYLSINPDGESHVTSGQWR